MKMRLTLRPKPPFDFHLTATHMYVLPPTKYSDGIFSRILRLRSGKLIRISVTSKGTVDKPKLSVLIGSPSKIRKEDKSEAQEKVSSMFGLEENLIDFYSLIKKDPILKYAKDDMYGLKMRTVPTFFEGIIKGFCLQWTSFQRGVRMMNALIRRFGERVGEDYAFPSAKALAGAKLTELKRCGLGLRAKRIKWLAVQVAKGRLDLEGLTSLPDERLRRELTKIKWVGPWTAEATLLWRLRRYDAFPIDVWSAKVIQAFYPRTRDRSLDEIKEFARGKWGGYKGLALYYLLCDRKNLSRRLKIPLDV